MGALDQLQGTALGTKYYGNSLLETRKFFDPVTGMQLDEV